MKSLIVKLVVLFLVLSLSAGLAFAQDKIVLTWGSGLRIDHPENQMALLVGRILEQRTNGRITLKLYPNFQMGTGHEMMEYMISGTLALNSGNFYDFVPIFMIAQMPYIWKSMDHVYSVYEDPYVKELIEKAAEQVGIRMLDVCKYGWRFVTTTKVPINSVEDMKGLKLRIPMTDAHREWAAAMGANATPMDFGEVYLGLKQGVVDGQDNPLPTIDDAKFYEVQKYLVNTKHMLSHNFILMSEKIWKSLSEEDQQILQDAIYAGVALNNRLIDDKERTLIDKFREEGMIVLQPDLEPFFKASLVVPDKLIKTDEARKFYETIVKIGENY